jgi:hypothetical protein
MSEGVGSKLSKEIHDRDKEKNLSNPSTCVAFPEAFPHPRRTPFSQEEDCQSASGEEEEDLPSSAF